MKTHFGLAVWAAALGVSGLAAAPNPDDAAIRRLNEDYVHAFLAADVARYRELLADDFSAVLATGRVIDRSEFLEQAAQPPGVVDFQLRDLLVRQYGDTAIVSGRLIYKRRDKTQVQTRYVDVYVRRGGSWKVEWAQFTRMAP